MKNVISIISTALTLMLTALLVSCIGSDGPDNKTFEEQLAADIETIDQYLEDNGIEADVHSSGIRYVSVQSGSGQIPFENEDVVIKYKGSLLNGDKVFESKYGSTFNLNTRLLTAWQIMLQEMREGDIITIYAPSGYCFGNSSSESIPANSIFEFDLELVRLINEEGEQLAADTTIIDEFLADNNITPVIHPSYIRYTVDKEGTGKSPELQDQVEVRYRGYYSTGQIFDESTDYPNGSTSTFSLNATIEAWRILLPEMKEGGKISMYAPSEYCYGPDGLGDILPNTVLFFEIELVSVK